MRTTPEGHGDTIPSDLGPAIDPVKPWTSADERAKRRKLAENIYERDGYRFWVGEDGRLNSEPINR